MPIPDTGISLRRTKIVVLESKVFLWAVIIAGILIIGFFAFRLGRKEIQIEEPEEIRLPEIKPPEPENKVEPEFVEEKKIITTTKVKKIPLILELPESCPRCDSPFKGKSGDACEYCGSVVRAKRVKAE
jgi:hypothetical protein